MVCKKIIVIGAEPGIVLHAKYLYPDLYDVIRDFKHILILSIEIPGSSGQIFIDESYNLIQKINSHKNRKNITLCVDGGVNIKNLNSFDCEKIVSASDILKSENSKKKIMALQTLSRYEKNKNKVLFKNILNDIVSNSNTVSASLVGSFSEHFDFKIWRY